MSIHENEATNLAIKVWRLQFNTQTQSVNTTELVYTLKTLNLILTWLPNPNPIPNPNLLADLICVL